LSIVSNPNELSAISAIEKIQSGELTSEALVEACLARIEKRENTIGAWQFVSTSQSLKTARKLDNDGNQGKLKGIPVGIKDIFNTADMPTEYGSKIYNGNHPPSDASCVTHIRAEGGIPIGKTVTTEFAFFKPGKTANPVNPIHTPGGSSSGSAAAVADFMVPLALGSQTVGSTIRPASFCGIIGYKPSFGLVDRTGVRALAETFDTIGIFSRTVSDAAYLASIISRRPSISIIGKEKISPRIGVCKTHEWSFADADSRTAVEKSVEMASASGAVLKEIDLPKPFDRLAQAQAVIADFEAANSAAYELHFHRTEVSKEYIERAEAGLSHSEEEYDDAFTVVLEATKIFQSIMSELDVILCPSAIGEAPKGLLATGDPIFNRVGTALKGPCINVPGLKGHSGLPVGVQLLGGYKKDEKVLLAADWLHEVLLRG